MRKKQTQNFVLIQTATKVVESPNQRHFLIKNQIPSCLRTQCRQCRFGAAAAAANLSHVLQQLRQKPCDTAVNNSAPSWPRRSLMR